MEHKMFSTLSPLRLFFRCALPSMAGMAVSSLYMVADGIFVGKFIGSHALAAINLVMPVIMISFALSDMIAVGSSVQISIRLGQGKEREACTVFSFSSCESHRAARIRTTPLATWPELLRRIKMITR